jgi:hypothetical protein
VNSEKAREELLSSISSLQPERRHIDVKAKRTKGTGAWFLNAPAFTAWSAFVDGQDYQALLSFGAPGAGKSILLCVFDRTIKQQRQQSS